MSGSPDSGYDHVTSGSISSQTGNAESAPPRSQDSRIPEPEMTSKPEAKIGPAAAAKSLKMKWTHDEFEIGQVLLITSWRH